MGNLSVGYISLLANKGTFWAFTLGMSLQWLTSTVIWTDRIMKLMVLPKSKSTIPNSKMVKLSYEM